MAAKRSQPPARRSAASSAPTKEVKGGKALTKDLNELDKQIVRTYHETDEKFATLYILITEADRRGLAEQLGFNSLADYLVARTGCGRRSAQQFAMTVTVFRRHGLDADVYRRLGPSKCREIASYIRRAQPGEKAAKSLIGRVEEQGWSTDQIQSHLSKLLEKQNVATDGRKQGDDNREPKKTWALSASDSQKQAITNAVDLLRPRLDAEQGKVDEATVIELVLSEAAASVSGDPEEALTYADRQSREVKDRLNEVVAAASALSTGSDEEREVGDELLTSLTKTAIDMVTNMGDFIDPEDDFDPEPILALFTGKKRSEETAFRRRASNIVRFLALTCGASKKDVSKIIGAMQDSTA